MRRLCCTVLWYRLGQWRHGPCTGISTGRPRSPMVSYPFFFSFFASTRAPMGETARGRDASLLRVEAPLHASSPVLGSPTAQRRQGKFVALPDRRTGHAIRFPCMDVLGSWSLEFQRPAGVSGKFLFAETLASERLVGMALLS